MSAEAKLAVNQKALALRAGRAAQGGHRAGRGAAAMPSEAQLALLQQQLADAELRAPVDAVVRSRLMEPGEMASPQKPVFTLAIIDPKWVRAYVAEPDLGKVHAGHARQRSTVDSFPGRRFEGWVGFISPVAEFTPKTVRPRSCARAWSTRSASSSTIRATSCGSGMPATVHLPLRQPASAARDGAGDDAGRRTAPRAASGRAADCASASPRKASDGRRRSTASRSRRAHGELTALVGPDGAGKTTLMRLAAGLLRADAGELTVLGIDVAADPQQVQDRIGYMPQRFGLYEDLTVQENLDLYADLHGVTRGRARAALSAADGDDGARRRSPAGWPASSRAA